MPTPAMEEVLAVFRTSNFLPINLFSALRDDLEVFDCGGVSPKSTSALIPLALILSLVPEMRAFGGFKPDWTLDLQ